VAGECRSVCGGRDPDVSAVTVGTFRPVTIRDDQLPVPVWRRTKAVFVSGFIRRPIGGPICLLWTQGRIIAVISVPPGDPPSRLVRPTLLAIQYPGVYTIAIPDV